jgi:hemerythrin superfamily protein
MEIYDILKTDHRNVLNMMDAVEKADEDDRKSILTLVHTELAMHSKAEEEVFYRPLKKKLSNHVIIDHSFDDHDEIDKLLGTLQLSSARKEEWMENIRKLRMVLERHIKTEESQVFLLAQEQFSSQEAQQIGLHMLAEKGKLGIPNPVTVAARKVKELVSSD